MSKNDENYSWLGWLVAIILAIIFVSYVANSNNDIRTVESSSESSSSYTQPATKTTTNEATAVEPTSGWQCYDATSYNGNAYDDNRCTDGTETRYVSDSQAIELDPDYSPGKSGASYYNAQ